MIGAQNISLLVLTRDREIVDFLKDWLFSAQNTCAIYTHICVTGLLLFTTIFIKFYVYGSVHR